jgi:hypothetical protein
LSLPRLFPGPLFGCIYPRLRHDAIRDPSQVSTRPPILCSSSLPRPSLFCPYRFLSSFSPGLGMAPRRRPAWPWPAAVMTAVVTAAAAVFAYAIAAELVEDRLTVGMTLIPDAASTGAGKFTAHCFVSFPPLDGATAVSWRRRDRHVQPTTLYM